MKKLIIIFIFIAVALTSCVLYFWDNSQNIFLSLSENQEKNSDTNLIEISTDKKIYNKEDKGMKITVYNNSDEDISTEHGFMFEVKKNSKWYIINADGMEGYFIFFNFWNIKSNEKEDEYFEFDSIKYKFISSYEYRLIKKIDNYIIISNVFEFE